MGQDDIIDLKRLGVILNRRSPLVAACIFVFLALAFGYLIVAPPKYTASASVFLDRTVTNAVSELSSIKEMGFDKSAIDSEVEVIQSRQVTLAAVDILRKQGYFADFETTPEANEELYDALIDSLDVIRLGETYVLKIAYTSISPQEAADVANAYATAYITVQLDSLYDTSERTAEWLKGKIEDLRVEALAAQERADDYRKRYNELQRDNAAPTPAPRLGLNGRDQISLGQLNHLEKVAETYTKLYESYLEQFQTISLQQSYPVTETRIITDAAAPRDKSHPQSEVIIGVALIFGTGLGILLALLIDSLDYTLRRAGQVTRETGQPFLGFLPARRMDDTTTISLTTAKKPHIQADLHGESLSEPLSLYAETIRAIRNAAEVRLADHTKKILAVASTDGHSGQNIVAQNLALYSAQTERTLLIEGNLRQSGVLSAHATHGLADVLRGTVNLDKVILSNADKKFGLLPSTAGEDAGHALAYLDTAHINAVLKEALKIYDTIIIDCPPMSSPADIHGFTRAAQGFVIVGEWGKTTPNTLNFHLDQSAIPADKILGVVLENADIKKLKHRYGHRAVSTQ